LLQQVHGGLALQVRYQPAFIGVIYQPAFIGVIIMTLLEQLRKANDDYHKAVDEILMIEETAVKNKVNFAAAIKQVFESMETADELAQKCTS